MEIIVSHKLTDFDALGAMIAVRKLYPEAKPVFVGRLHQPVKDFMALYRDEVDIYRLKDIDITEIERIIVVDTYTREALGELNKKLNLEQIEVILYDHHPHSEELNWVDIDLSQETGAATSILIHKLEAEGIHLNPLEATICALGIYADTGFLSHENTTSRDVRAVAFLLDAGANLKIINQFLGEALTGQQQELLDNLLEQRENLNVEGIDITLFYHQQDEYITGLNRVTEKIKSLYQLPTVFLLVEMDGKLEIVGRSSQDSVDVGRICASLGGGGHQGAGAAQLKTSLTEGKKKLKKLIKTCVQPGRRIKSIMSTPVRTISPDTTIAEAEDFMEKFGHNGVVVCQDGEIEGVFSRRDLDKVKGHDLMHAPVKAYMSTNVITIESEATIRQAQEMMVKYNVGRLPVLKNGEMVGIVTRSDILGSYYEHETPHRYQNRYGSSLVNIRTEVSDVRSKLDYFPDEILSLLKRAGQIGDRLDSRLYLIGGMVRDMLLEKENYDLDLVIEGDLREFMNEFADDVEGEVNYNPEFHTANIMLPSGYNLDIAATRRERYLYAGALPEVERTNIFEDLFRRDFTINALALAIYPDKWGQLFDFFQGRKDLHKGILRALHRFSFLDDPTRIIRGIRLALNLGFDFERETKSLMQEALELGDFSGLSLDRVYKELKSLFSVKDPGQFKEILSRLPLFKLIDSNFSYESRYDEEIKCLQNNISYFKQKGYKLDEALLWLALFFNDMNPESYQTLSLNQKERNLYNLNKNKYFAQLEKNLDVIQLYEQLESLSPEQLIILIVKSNNEKITNKIRHYIETLQDIKVKLNGNDLINMGLKPGPVIRYVLNRVWRARIAGKVDSIQDEKELAQKIIKQKEWSE